jgi:hypothetical protein
MLTRVNLKLDILMMDRIIKSNKRYLKSEQLQLDQLHHNFKMLLEDVYINGHKQLVSQIIELMDSMDKYKHNIKLINKTLFTLQCELEHLEKQLELYLSDDELENV